MGLRPLTSPYDIDGFRADVAARPEQREFSVILKLVAVPNIAVEWLGFPRSPEVPDSKLELFRLRVFCVCCRPFRPIAEARP
jgi:hypothetical protein